MTPAPTQPRSPPGVRPVTAACLVPLVYRGAVIGLLVGERRPGRARSQARDPSAQAVAGQAAGGVAQHDRCTPRRAPGRDDLSGLRSAPARRPATPLAAALGETDEEATVERLARGRSVTSWGRSRASLRRRAGRRAPRSPLPRSVGRSRPARGRPARDGRVLVGREASGDVSMTATLPQAPSDGVAELLDLIAAVAAARPERAARLASGGARPGAQRSHAGPSGNDEVVRRPSSAHARETRRCRPTTARP